MKYEKPIICTLNHPISAVCSAGSNAGGSYGNCIVGPSVGGNCYTNGTAPGGALCQTGTENQVSCNPNGNSAGSTCSVGSGVRGY